MAYRVALFVTLVVSFSGPAFAGPDPCTADPLEGNRVICTGDQSAGIASGIDFNAASFDTLDIFNAQAITPVAGKDGVVFRRTSAGDVTVNTSLVTLVPWIITTGANARGIVAESVGTPPPAVNDPFLGIPIPGESVSGGVVEVNHFGLIITDGDGGHAISASSRTSGYSAAVTNALENFDPSPFSFTVVSAFDPVSGSQVLPDQGVVWVPGILYERVDTNGDGVLEEREVVGGDGGSCGFQTDGVFFCGGGARGANLFTRVQYLVEGAKTGGVTEQADGFVDVSLDPATLGTWTTSFADTVTGDPKWGDRGSDSTSFFDPGATLPNLESYVADLVEQTSAGGVGNSVSVNLENGSYTVTSGAGAHGIFAESVGARGADGRDASNGTIFIGGHSSTRGQPGNAGGAVSVDLDGTISTTGVGSSAVVAESTGGNGGQGGDATFGRNSKAGGAGGSGGAIFVQGDATGNGEGIGTSGANGIGIFAISRGGNGGGGGDGAELNSAEDGGPGGSGGAIDIRGTWRIATAGADAHGIWGKSVGGVAGGGGDGGWTGTSGGDGGQATGGGNVTIDTDGVIQTTGDDAYGIYAQSIGGFGGNGGDTSGIFVAHGGSGKSAGPGGDIDVTNRGIVTTGGENSHAIFAQSIGGGGGSGGDGGALAGYGGGSASGGHGGDVTVLNAGAISTFNKNARGIYAQSIGGGGGDGGDGSGFAGIGGRGSGTSAGGKVFVTNDGGISTFGDRANAIFAESVGGGGGDGGDSAGLISIGGSGGGGGDADIVTVDNNNLLETTGDDASAIFAQSVGGGGGNGGSSLAFGAFASVAIGGDGAAGGNAGEEVRIGNAGTITTDGDRSHGIFAQSVGGGGGNGGFAISASVGEGASFSAAIGGKGGGGGLGKLVTVTSGGEIVTNGKDAHGIFAQSVGGGGGSGGFAIAASASDGYAGSAALGGKGGVGNRGGAVVVDNTANVTTGIVDPATLSIDQLERIDADITQLLSANFATVEALSAATKAQVAAIPGIDGVTDATVDVLLGMGISQATIDLLRSRSFATIGSLQVVRKANLVAIPGIDENIAAQIIEQTRRYVQTIPETLLDAAALQMQQGNHAYGILAQSVGGGGGDGGFSVAGAISGSGSAAFSMGGNGGSGGAAGTVDLGSTGNISTRGKDAHAIVAQSVGGGGGTGGFSVAGSLSAGNGAAAAIGGAGGGGGDGGPVRGGSALAPLSGDITTVGDHAYGLLAQSVGGGGGDGGFSVAGTLTKGSAAAFGMGGSGGPGGIGGLVDVQSDANFTTSGKDAHGIVAQSIGGGGGSGGFSIAGGMTGDTGIAASIGGKGEAGGDAGTVTLVSAGAIQTGVVGKYSVGVESLVGSGLFAQLLSAAGYDTIAKLAATKQDEVQSKLGTDPAVLEPLLAEARRFMQQDSHSYGILAQSVGGGGGDGGFSVAGSVSTESSYGFGLGGAGGAGGDGKSVDVDVDGPGITTNGQLGYGIFVQSVGGGGGSGGFGVSASQSKNGRGINASVGGAGGAGGNGGPVGLDNFADIETRDLGSHAILAQSVGGGGGAGGFSGSFAGGFGDQSKLSVAIGGSGGSAGDGNTVRVDNRDSLMTLRQGSVGIYAQSVGGGGGDGGFSLAASLGESEKNWTGSVAIGGDGGGGGNGNSVTVINSGVIASAGAESHGVFAQSVGGGGGNGGFSVAGNLNLQAQTQGATQSFGAGVSVGGGGGNGGIGGNVDVTNSNAINTAGRDSLGIMAQSLGGGGGNGGMALVAQLTGGAATTAEAGVSVGGGGGNGNEARMVSVANSVAGAINTSGFGSHGIQAQSIGGGGGNGGMAIVAQVGKHSGTTTQQSKTLNVGVAVGGAGGDGGIGNLVNVTNDAAVDVAGSTAIGIYAQSVGGGGGDGGGSVTAFGHSSISAIGASKIVNIGAVVGGAGGDGNHGGVVGVTNTGGITTGGGSGYGIVAQSVGGGGGIGGRANAFDVMQSKSRSKDTDYGLAATVGGAGGGASDGRDVTVDNSGRIETLGAVADGIFAQSIGGGGGAGGNGINGFEELVPIPEQFNIVTEVERADIKQLVVSVGGDSGSSGNGGAVQVFNADDIITRGSSSAGIRAQSVGGGGGVGGVGATGLAGAVGLGGKGGASGHGSDVVVFQTGGTIETHGEGSTGIFAHSIGGGGGIAGNVNRAFSEQTGVVPGVDLPGLNFGVGFGLGQGGGAGGDGAQVAIAVDGGIVTHGDEAAAVIAESIGGGGGGLGDLGNGAQVQLPVFFGSNGDAGSADRVTVDVNASIRTAGNNATGVFAQSSAGTGLSGTVHVNVDNASILTGEILDPTFGGADLDSTGNPIRGREAIAIIAQSVSNGAGNNANNGNVEIEIEGAGSVVRGGRRGADVVGIGIAVIDGNQNTIINNGLVTTLDGVDDGYAIAAWGSRPTAIEDSQGAVIREAQLGGDETVTNLGTVTGSVVLGEGTDAFINETTGTLNAGAMIELGAGELFTNGGWLAPGGDGSIFTTTLDGDLLQTATGTISLDVAMGPAGLVFDQLFVTGDVDLGGGLGAPLGVQNLSAPNAGSGLGGAIVFSLGDALTLADLVDTISIFDLLLGGSPGNPVAFVDSGLFDEITFMGKRPGGGTFELLLKSDGTLGAVPVPASVWLFGSALALLGWVRRRGTNQAGSRPAFRRA